jgi:hypothetical protein
MTRHRVQIGLAAAIVLMADGTSAAPLQDVERSTLQSAQAVDNTTPDDKRAVEAETLKQPGIGARRDGDRLTLRLSNRAERILRDKPECRTVAQEARCETYIFIVHARSQHLFVVAHGFYESVEYLLIDDRSGQQSVIDGFPIFSPSGRYVLQITPDNSDGDPLVLWRRSGRRFVRAWAGSLAPFGVEPDYELVDWPTDSRLRLGGHPTSGSSDGLLVELSKIDARWRLFKSR